MNVKRSRVLSCIILVSLLPIAITFSSCGRRIDDGSTYENNAHEYIDQTRITANPNGYGVTRVEDWEAGVVCYVYKAIDGAGISCLPISETDLQP